MVKHSALALNRRKIDMFGKRYLFKGVRCEHVFYGGVGEGVEKIDSFVSTR